MIKQDKKESKNVLELEHTVGARFTVSRTYLLFLEVAL